MSLRTEEGASSGARAEGEGTEGESADEEWIEYEPVRGQVTLTGDDYAAAHLLRADHQGTARSMRIVLAATLVIAWLGWAATGTVGVWTCLLVAVGALMMVARKQHAWMGRAVFEGRPDHLRDRLELTIDHESVRRKAARWDNAYAWVRVTGWLESPDLFVLLGPEGVLDVLPKRAFDRARWEDLRELFHDCIESPEPTDDAAAPTRRSFLKTAVLWVLLIVMVVAIYQLVRP